MPGIGNAIGIPWRRGGGAVTVEAPTGLTLTVLSDTEIKLDWTGTENNYRVYISTDGISFSEDGTAETNTYTATGLTAGNTYYFYVVAYRGETETDPTDTENVKIETELTAYLSGLVTSLSGPQVTRLNTLLTDLKTGLSLTSLISEAFDLFYVLAGETEESSLRNLVSNTYHNTNISETSFTAFKGFTGDAVADCLNTGWKPKTNGVRYLLNTCSLGILNLNDNVGGYVDVGCRDGSSTNRTFIECRGTDNWAFCYINTNSTTNGVASRTFACGYFTASRTASNLTNFYHGRKLLLGSSNASNDRPNYNLYILAINTADSIAAFSPNTAAMVYAGKDLSAANVTAIINAYTKYLIGEFIMFDSAYCWFTKQNALYNSTAAKSWVGCMCNSGNGFTQHILSIVGDGTTTATEIGTVYAIEDHNEPSILVRSSDNKLFTAYCEHNASTNIRYRISTNALDATAWGAESQVAGATTVSYASCFEAANGDIFIFYREATAGYCYIKSSDGGSTFGGRVNFFHGTTNRGYALMAQSPLDKDIIHFLVSTSNPQEESDVSVYAFYFNCGEAKFYKLDGTEITGSIPLVGTEATTIKAVTDPDICWIEDIIVDSTGKPRYLFTYYPNGKNVDYATKDLYYAEWTGSEISTPYKIHTATIRNICGATTASYMPNSCFDVSNPNIIFASKDVDNICEIHKITRISSSSFNSEQKTFNSRFDNWRPISTGAPTYNVFWTVKMFYSSYWAYVQAIKGDTF